MKIKINWFKISDRVLPEVVHVYRSYKIFEGDGDIYRFASSINGKVVDAENQLIVSTLEPNNPRLKELEDLKDIETKPFSELSPPLQRVLVKGIVDKECNLHRLLDSVVVKLLKEGVIESFESDGLSVKPYFDYTVEHLDGSFFLTLRLRYDMVYKKNVWDLVGRNRERLESLVGKRIQNIFSWQRSSFKIVEIRDPDEDLIRAGIIPHFVKNGYIKSEENIFKRVGEVDWNQPIIDAVPISGKSNKKYPFAPQFSRLVFEMGDLDGQTAKEVRKLWTRKNTKLGRIIEKAGKILEKTKIIVGEPLSVDAAIARKPDLLVRDEKGEIVTIKDTYSLFYWLSGKGRRVYLPYEVPDIIEGAKIPTPILIDQNIEEKEKVRKFVTGFFGRYNEIANSSKIKLPYFNYAGKTIYFSNAEDAARQVKELMNSEKFETEFRGAKVKFALIVGKEVYADDDYYEELKRLLFKMGIASQNVLWKNLTNRKLYQSVLDNLILQMHSKLGIKYFALKYDTNYDYILGIDAGPDATGVARIGGCAVVYDSRGVIKEIYPVKVPQPGETVNMSRIFEELVYRSGLNFDRKKVLVLRDGKIQKEEINHLVEISKKHGIGLTIIGIRKNHSTRMFTDEIGSYAIVGDVAFLLPHTTDAGSVPVKIEEKVRINGKSVTREKITDSDIELLYTLTKMNYSTLFGKYLNIKLPAPVHYADKFVEAIRKDWELDRELLKRGLLYFI